MKGLPSCSLDAVLRMVSGRWKTLILRNLLRGPCRYSELRRRIGSVSERMLARQLQQLESDGFIVRTVYPEVPPRVEYELSERGRSLAPLLQQLCSWAEQNLEIDMLR